LKKQAAKKEAALVESLKAIAAKLVGISLKITAKAGESGRLFGSVTSQHVAAALKDQAGVEVDKRLIEMPEEVKEIGAYTAVIKFHPEVVSELRFDVASENNRNDHD
jgi:large subunit ribosomal protein L9